MYQLHEKEQDILKFHDDKLGALKKINLLTHAL